MSRLVRVTRWAVLARPRTKPYHAPEPWALVGFRPAVLVFALVLGLILGALGSAVVRGAVLSAGQAVPSVAGLRSDSTAPPTTAGSIPRWQEPVERQVTASPSPTQSPVVSPSVRPDVPKVVRKRAVPAAPSWHAVSGIASWYSWHVGEAAACAPLRHALGSGWRGRTVTVLYGGLSRRVKLTDYCPQAHRIIDLDTRTFDDFAALSAGLIHVSVRW